MFIPFKCCCCCCWSLSYSAILRSRADSLCSHVILHEWLAFFIAHVLNIHQIGVLTALAWLVPHETAADLVCSVYTIQPYTMSLHAKPHMYGAGVSSCNLPPALLVEWPGSFMCYCGNTGGRTDTGIGVSTESWPWRRKFSHRSFRDSNPQPSYHESDALTTELSPLTKRACCQYTKFSFNTALSRNTLWSTSIHGLKWKCFHKGDG